jgi:Ca-activated chloride channel homolog
MARTLLATIAFVSLIPAACVAQTPIATGGGGQQQQVVAAGNGLVTLNAGLESAYVLQGAQGQAYLVIDLAAAAPPQQAARPAMAVALVVDRSGSMSGDKIQHARTAAASFIASMADGDVVAIYQYDDTIEQLAPPTVVNANTRDMLTSTVHHMTPRGSTNLHGGMMAGIQALTSAMAERPVRRVVLISDGQANVGPSTPAELGNVAAAAAARGISITTIGVGLDYDDAVMTTVAVRAGGRFYHLREPAQMAAILETELNALSATVAHGVLIELQPAPQVQILGASGADLNRRGDQIALNVGDMLGNQSRQVVVPIQVATSGQGELPLGTLRLRYRSAASGEELTQDAAVSYQLTNNAQLVNQHVDPRFAVAVETYRNAEAQRQAAALVSRGDAVQAASVLRSRAQSQRSRANALGGAAGQQLMFSADDIDERAGGVEAARSAPARRAAELDLQDSAMEAEGY